MGTILVVAFTFVVVLSMVVVLSTAANSLRKSGQKLRHHKRCEACDSRLKATNGPYAIRCRKCGQVQSWSLKAAAGLGKPAEPHLELWKKKGA
jgi:hypothetical protein